jgi:hypothetical protein
MILSLVVSNPATAIETNSTTNTGGRLARETTQGLSTGALKVLVEWLRSLLMDGVEGLFPQKHGAKQFYEALLSSGSPKSGRLHGIARFRQTSGRGCD